MSGRSNERALQKHIDHIVRRIEKKYLRKLYYLTIIGPLVGLATFVAARVWFKEEITESAVISLLITLFTDRVVEFFSRASAEKDAYERHETLAAGISSANSIQKIGYSNEVLHIVFSSIERAISVRNTFVVVNDGIAPNAAHEDKMLKAYIEFLRSSENAVWTDVVSVNELFNFRHTRIRPDEKLIGNHYIHLLRHNSPIINFIILDYWNSTHTEVYFGWIYTQPPKIVPIYRSSDPDIVRLFASYFEILTDRKSYPPFKVDYQAPISERMKSIDFVDKVGLWCTAAVRPERLEMKDGVQVLVEAEILNGAIMKIGFEDAAITLEGHIVDDKAIGDRYVRHVEVTHTHDRIYFEYDEEVVGNPVMRRYCVYRFMKSNGESVINGTRYDSSDRRMVHIFGFKLDDGAFDAEALRDPEAVRAVVAANRARLARISQASWYEGALVKADQSTISSAVRTAFRRIVRKN